MGFKLNRTGSIFDRQQRINENENWGRIENVINDRGLEILSEEWFKQYLDTSGIKHQEEVQTISDLPADDSLNTVRGVADDNKIYIKKENGWVPFQTIDISKINELDERLSKSLSERTTTERKVILNKSLENKTSSGVSGKLVQKPSWFTWNAPINIYEKDGIYYTDFDVSVYEPNITGKTYYIDPVNGSDSNDGLSIETSRKSINQTILKGDAGEIWVAGGIVKRVDLPAEIPDRNLSIKALPGAKVTFSCHDDLNWSLVSGRNNTYQTSRSSVDWVWDAKNLDEYGDIVLLTSRNSVSAVESNPGSYYIDGSIVYVHTHDSRNLVGDTDIRVYLSTLNLRHQGGRTIYLEGISFEGGRFGIWNTTTGLNPLLLAKNCSFKYMAGNYQGGFELIGGDAYLQNCVAARNIADGFNYHIGNGIKNRVIEVDCIGRFNGNRLSAIHSDNGSTMHDGGQIIRVNGAYFGNEGPNVADVNDGTQSWNLGSIGLESRSDVNGADFRARDNMYMKLEGCITSNPLKIESASGAILETEEVITNAKILSENPLEVSIPSLISAVVQTLNTSIGSINERIPFLQQDIQTLSTKTVHSSGTNANGHWIRFQDGTQIAVTNLIYLNGENFVADGALFRSSNVFTVPFPNDFIGTTYQTIVVPRRIDGSGADNRVWATMYTRDSFMLYKTNDTALTGCGYVATIIGRWK